MEDRVPASESITYIEFALSDSTHPFVAASVDGGRVALQEIIPRGGGTYGEFFSVVGREPDEIMTIAESHGTVDAELVARRENGGLFEFVVSENCPAVFLGEEGALPREIDGVDGTGRIAAEVPADVDSSTVIGRFLDRHSDAELVSKRQQPYRTPIFSQRELRDGVEDQLTDRQREVLTTAYEAGYYTWPRGITGEELAEELGISAPTLHQHLRHAEQKLVAMVFDTGSPQETTGSRNPSA
jgi:DNA-binding CsgD family transcriptional regulator